jgi:hypothetical protein
MESCSTTGKKACGCGCDPNCQCGPDCKCACNTQACGTKKCVSRCCLAVLVAGLITAGALYVFEAFWHSQFMMPLYEKTQNVWRSWPEMQALNGYYILGLILIGITLSFIFTRNYQNGGLAEGIRFGFYLGLLIGLIQFMAYIYLPIPMEIGVRWFFGWVIEGVIAGITLSLTFMAFQCGRKMGGC